MVTIVMMTFLMTTVMTASEDDFNTTAAIQAIIESWSDKICNADNYDNFVPFDSFLKEVLFISYAGHCFV